MEVGIGGYIDGPHSAAGLSPGFFRLGWRNGTGIAARIERGDDGWSVTLDGCRLGTDPNPWNIHGMALVWFGGRRIEEDAYFRLLSGRAGRELLSGSHTPSRRDRSSRQDRADLFGSAV